MAGKKQPKPVDKPDKSGKVDKVVIPMAKVAKLKVKMK